MSIVVVNRMGLSLAELKATAREANAKQRKEAARQIAQSAGLASAGPLFAACPSSAYGDTALVGDQVCKDSSPVKPLSSIMNIPRLLSTPHTAIEISALWTGYHTSHPGATRYISASVPPEMYKKMTCVGRKYPIFVVPVSKVKSSGSERGVDSTSAYEFHILQWDFHGAPPAPSTIGDSFSPNIDSDGLQISTIMFTPLQEYKMRASFATPHLVLTFYTDLVDSHATVLMRGEITPAGANGRHLLSQHDAQLLAIQVQKFYLWGESNEGKGKDGKGLLQAFHENPEEFKWEELLKYVYLSG